MKAVSRSFGDRGGWLRQGILTGERLLHQVSVGEVALRDMAHYAEVRVRRLLGSSHVKGAEVPRGDLTIFIGENRFGG
jgi:hypothetical protein